MSMLTRSRKKTTGDSYEGWKEVAAVVRTITAGRTTGPLRLKRENLTGDERGELIGLVRAGWSDGSFNAVRLDRGDRKRFERLVSQASGVDLAKERADADADRAFLALDRELRQPPRRVRLAEPGSVGLSSWLLESCLDQSAPALWISDLGLLCFVLLQLENATPLTPQGAIEGGGAEIRLVVDVALGLGAKFDDDSRIGNSWIKDAENLGRLDLLSFERRGRQVVLGFGPRYLQWRAGKP